MYVAPARDVTKKTRYSRPAKKNDGIKLARDHVYPHQRKGEPSNGGITGISCSGVPVEMVATRPQQRSRHGHDSTSGSADDRGKMATYKAIFYLNLQEEFGAPPPPPLPRRYGGFRL
jgi:hypothetical protein